MKRILLSLFAISLLLSIIACSKVTIRPVEESYPVWEESAMAHNEEYVVWRKYALLNEGGSYTVWEENELSRGVSAPVFETLDEE